MDDGNPPLSARYNLLGCPRGLPTIHSATSAQRCKTVNDRSGTQLVDILIRLVDGIARFADCSPAFPRGLRGCGESSTVAEKFLGAAQGYGGGLQAKKKGPGEAEALFYLDPRIRPMRRRCRHRRRPGTSRTNPCQISCWHCPRRTVNASYTLISKVNRVLTINHGGHRYQTGSYAVRLCGETERLFTSSENSCGFPSR